MVKINQEAFALKIEEYLRDTNSFDEDAIEDTLRTKFEEPYVHKGEVSALTHYKGICFGYTIKLVMLLFENAYNGLTDNSDVKTFSKSVSEAMQRFADPFPNKSQPELCYPHFLLHDIAKPSLEQVIDKIDNNSRIIHETLAGRLPFMKKYNRTPLDHGLKLFMDAGLTDDYFAICSFIAHKAEKRPSATYDGYISKVSFFTDVSNNEIYVLTIQSSRFKLEKNMDKAKIRQRGRFYARLAAKLGMDPRAYLLTKVSEIAKSNDFTKIKVIKPHSHPMFIEGHKSFLAKYEPVIIQAGITQENGCYLEQKLK